MRCAERQYDAFVGSGGLELEVEALAEFLSEREAPGAVDAAAERGVHGELHPAAFIEEALEHQRLRAGHDTKCPLPLGQICRDLLGGGARELVVLREPSDGAFEFAFGARLLWPRQQRVCGGAQPGDGRAHLVAARRRLTEPERHRRRLALRVGHPHDAAADPEDPP